MRTITIALAVIAAASPATARQTTPTTFQQTRKFTGTAQSPFNGLSLAADGSSIIVAGGNSSIGYRDCPLVLQAGAWVNQGTLPGGPWVGNPRPIVAHHGDLALAGFPAPTTVGNSQVAVHRRSGSVWSTTYISSPIPPGTIGRFGAALAIDGTTVAIGEPDQANPITGQGALHIYQDTGASLVHRQTLYGNNLNRHLGQAIAIHGDEMLVGATFNNAYRVVVFGLDGAGNWSEGTSVVTNISTGFSPLGAIRFDSQDFAVVGAWGAGCRVLSKLTVSGWQLDGTISNNGTSGDFGMDVDIRDGTVVIGSGADTFAGFNAGAVYVYSRNGGWTQEQVLRPSDIAPGDSVGASVEIDGDRLFVGAPGQDGFATDRGAVYEYTVGSGPVRVYCVATQTSAGCIPRIGFNGTASVSSATNFALSAINLHPQSNALLVYSTSGRNHGSFPYGFRCLLPPLVRTFGVLTNGVPGAGCSGAAAFDFNAWIASGIDPQLVAGTQVQAQFVFRDQGGVTSFGYSEAVELTILP